MSRSKGLDWAATHERLARARAAIESSEMSAERRETLQRERAEALARLPAEEVAGDAEVIMVFRIGSGSYGVPISRVTEVASKPAVAPAPGAPAEIAGLIQIRGEIRVVWDLGKLLGIEAAAPAAMKLALLVRNAAGGESGLLVEEIIDIRAVKETDRLEPPENVSHALWATTDLVTVLNIETLLPGVTGESATA